ncbi:Unknown protein sequence [Pseudomonas syringae pv. maculicola]|nr:Unknown protein sequence [Pseudomonas syringae pv. maculicola]
MNHLPGQSSFQSRFGHAGTHNQDKPGSIYRTIGERPSSILAGKYDHDSLKLLCGH